jgi:hypothetical protein
MALFSNKKEIRDSKKRPAGSLRKGYRKMKKLWRKSRRDIRKGKTDIGYGNPGKWKDYKKRDGRPWMPTIRPSEGKTGKDINKKTPKRPILWGKGGKLRDAMKRTKRKKIGGLFGNKKKARAKKKAVRWTSADDGSMW